MCAPNLDLLFFMSVFCFLWFDNDFILNQLINSPCHHFFLLQSNNNDIKQQFQKNTRCKNPIFFFSHQHLTIKSRLLIQTINQKRSEQLVVSTNFFYFRNLLLYIFYAPKSWEILENGYENTLLLVHLKDNIKSHKDFYQIL